MAGGKAEVSGDDLIRRIHSLYDELMRNVGRRKMTGKRPPLSGEEASGGADDLIRRVAELETVIRESVFELEKTKTSFKSKRIKEIKERLMQSIAVGYGVSAGQLSAVKRDATLKMKEKER